MLGGAVSDTAGVGFVPPRADQLDQAASNGEFPRLDQAKIHVGSENWQSNSEVVRAFGKHAPILVEIVVGKGHMLGVDYVGPLLDRRLGKV